MKKSDEEGDEAELMLLSARQSQWTQPWTAVRCTLGHVGVNGSTCVDRYR
jgi:hypothetical protein